MSFVTSYTGGSGSGIGIQFVDSIQTSPTVRLDLNNQLPFMVASWQAPPPPLRRAKVTTFLADGELVTAARHSNRQIVLELHLTSPAGPDAASAALQQLGVELNRPNNILRFQMGSHTTFFRTYQSDDFDLEMSDFNGALWTQKLTLEAEPYALGLPIQVLTGYSLASDPAVSGRYVDVNGVIGDVESPLVMTFRPSTTPWQPSVVSVRRGGNPSNVGHVLQAELGSVGFDTTVAGSHDAAVSGTGNNYTRTTFASGPGMVNRLGFLFPPAPSTDARGQYRVFACVRRIASGSNITLSASYGGTLTSNGIGTNVTAVADPGIPSPTLQMLDLGVISVPTGTDPVTQGYSNTPMPVAPGRLWILANRDSGTDTLDIDYVLLLPADDRMTVVQWNYPALGTTDVGVLDGTSDTVYQITDPTAVSWTVTPSTHFANGDLPMVSPGNNRVYVINKGITALADLTVVSAWYWPRYLTLATT